MHWKMYKSINSAKSGFLEEMNEAPTFWCLTINAHLESARVALSRVYDQNKSAVSLRKMLQHVCSNLDIMAYVDPFDPDFERVSKERISRDIARCSGSDSLIKTLKIQRDKAIAHIASRPSEQAEVSENPLRYGMIEELLERADDMFNFYSVRYDGMSHFVDLRESQHQDYENVLVRAREGRLN